MGSPQNESLSSSMRSTDDLPARLKSQADGMLAEIVAQNPLDIDIVGRVEFLPESVFDAVVDLEDQLNEASRTAIDEWQEHQRQRARELWELMERNHAKFVASLPPNWQFPEVEFPDLSELEGLQLKEGIGERCTPSAGSDVKTSSRTSAAQSSSSRSPGLLGRPTAHAQWSI